MNSDYDPGGREFESLRARHINKEPRHARGSLFIGLPEVRTPDEIDSVEFEPSGQRPRDNSEAQRRWPAGRGRKPE